MPAGPMLQQNVDFEGFATGACQCFYFDGKCVYFQFPVLGKQSIECLIAGYAPWVPMEGLVAPRAIPEYERTHFGPAGELHSLDNNLVKLQSKGCIRGIGGCVLDNSPSKSADCFSLKVLGLCLRACFMVHVLMQVGPTEGIENLSSNQT